MLVTLLDSMVSFFVLLVPVKEWALKKNEEILDFSQSGSGWL